MACEADRPSAPRPPPPPVLLDAVRLEALVPRVSATAAIRPRRSAQLAMEAAGRVASVHFEVGDQVSRGRVLVRLDRARPAATAEAAAAAIAQADAALAQATRARAVAERLAESGSVSTRSLDDARDAEEVARAAAQASRAQARVTRRGLAEAVLRAPFSGTVSARTVEVGEWMAPGRPLGTLMDLSELRARVLLDPRRALSIEVGADALVSVFALPEARFSARVIRVEEAVDPRTRRLPVELRIEDPARRLRPGLVARFSVRHGPERRALTVDAEAPFERFDERYVYVVGAEVARRRSVTLGPTWGERVEVLAGLRRGERVVVAGQDRVFDGAPVRVVTPTIELTSSSPLAADPAPRAAESGERAPSEPAPNGPPGGRPVGESPSSPVRPAETAMPGGPADRAPRRRRAPR